MIRTTLFMGCALAATVLVTPVSAQGPVDQKTYFTFSAPFELPGGKTLPAGKYTFRIADSPSNRHIVHILNEDGTEMHATLLAIPAERQDPAPEPEIRFMETTANMPPAIRTWWYPGRTIGHEFIYPKDHARRLAAAQREPVLTVAGAATTAEDMAKAELARIDAAGREARVAAAAAADTAAAEARADAEAARTAASEAARTAAAQAPRVETRAADQPRTELPRTASPLPLLGLIGVASLAGAAVLGLRRRRA